MSLQMTDHSLSVLARILVAAVLLVAAVACGIAYVSHHHDVLARQEAARGSRP